jgi:outer membrane murein-binding lipoprotein Lpp
MRNNRLSLLVVAAVAAIILVAGCTSSNQPSSSNQVTNTSTSSTSTSAATSSSVARASPTVKPSASISPTPSASPTATPTPAPSGSGKVATSIQFDQAPPATVKRGTPVNLGIEVIGSTSSPPLICGHGMVTASMGTVTQGEASGCFRTAQYSLDTSSLSPGTYTVTLNYAGDSTYQSSQSTAQITVTA